MYGTWQLYADETNPIGFGTDSGSYPLYRRIEGDVDWDADVEFDDYADVVIAFGYTGPPGDGNPADMNFDGDVDFADYAITVINFNKTYPPPEPPSEPLGVPEPTTVVLLAFAALCLAGRARRR